MSESTAPLVRVSDTAIDIKNVAWRGELIQRYHAMLVGGSLFDSCKRDFLIKKPSESQLASMQSMPGSGSPDSSPQGNYGYYQQSSINSGSDQYEYRARKVSYKPLIASLFGYLASRVFPRDPEVSGSDRFTAMVEDCDGDGRTMLSVVRDALINAIAYSVPGAPCGSYLYVQEVDPEDLRITTVDARTVIDWVEDTRGRLSNVRTRHVEPVREDAFGPQTKMRWTWREYDAEGFDSWVGEKAIRSIGRPAQARYEGREPFAYGALPFIRVKLSEHQFLMDQIVPPIVEQFNLESDIASLCGKISNSQLAITSMDKNLGQVILAQLGVILMDQGMDAKFISPDPKCADPLFRYKDALRESLYNAINASAMRASADLVQNPRQAATAKAMDLEPWRAWSITFSNPVRSAFNKAIEIVADYYGEPVPEIKWPDPLDISQEGLQQMLSAYAAQSNVKTAEIISGEENGASEKDPTAGTSDGISEAAAGRV